MKDTLIAILILIVLVLGYFFIKEKNQDDNRNPWPETEPATQTPTNNYPTQNGSTTTNNNSQNGGQDQIAWNTSEMWGLFYPAGWTITTSENSPGFSFTNGNAVINYGGNQSACSQNQHGVFQYGVSVSTCLNGLYSNIGLINVRSVLSQTELNVFGDFVLKNQR